jgi:hypothetical protein
MAMDADTYLSQRVDDQLAWLGTNSRTNKAAFMRLRVVSIVLGALVTVLSPYANQAGPLKDWIPPALQLAGVGVALTGALSALYRHQENWLRYRGLKEALEREKMLYLTGSLPAYRGPEAFHCFVRNVEDLMASERTTWARQTAPEGAQEPQPPGPTAPEEGLAPTATPSPAPTKS